MTWQAYIDESIRSDDPRGYFVMGGCISTAERWEQFSKEWQEILPFGRVDERTGQRFFHMAEMRDMHHVSAFYRVIERHVPIFISARYRRGDLRNAMERIVIPNTIIEWDLSDYYIGFRCLMDKFHLERENALIQRILPSTEKVQFIFDENSSKSIVRKTWDKYMETRPPELRDLYAGEPLFRDDKDLSPLQAADFWTWWVRHWAERGEPERIIQHDFSEFKRNPELKRLTIDISFNEEQFIPTLERDARAQAGPDREVVVLPSWSKLHQWRV